MDQQLQQLEVQAVDAAVNSNWDIAIKINNQIIKLDKTNVGAHLRQGFAHLQTENISNAKKFYQKALRLQPRNQIATENLERISILEEKGNKKNPIKIKASLNPSLFMEVPGKTKSATLVDLGQKNHLAELDIGEEIELKAKKRRIEVRTLTGEYIGYLPDDLSKRIIYFLNAGSVYKAYVKDASIARVVIFIHEEKKGKKVMQYSSFPHSNRPIHTPVDRDIEEGEEEEAEMGEFEMEGLHDVETEKEEIGGIHTEEEEEEEE